MLKLRCLSVLFSITYCEHDSKTHDKLLYTTLDGNNFLSKFPKGVFVKVLNFKEKHNGFQYTDGKNEDDLPFNSSGQCEPGGLYFTEKNLIFDYLSYGDHIRIIKILPDSKIYIESGKYKANKLELGKSYKFSEFFETFFTKEELLNMLEYDYRIIKYFSKKSITPEIIKFLVNLDSIDKFNIIPEFILTTEMLISCIEKNHKYVKYIPENLLSKELYKCFITKDYRTIIFIPNKFLTITECFIKQILIYYTKTNNIKTDDIKTDDIYKFSNNYNGTLYNDTYKTISDIKEKIKKSKL